MTDVTSSLGSGAARSPAFGARWLLLAIGGRSLAILPLFLTNYQIGLATEMLIFAILAMSIDILAGFAGRTSLGHGAIFGVSTYVVIYMVTRYGLPPASRHGRSAYWPQRLVAAIFALLAVRTSGVYFLLLTLALGMIVWGICLRWTQVTGGENGLRGDLRPASSHDAQPSTGSCWPSRPVVATRDVALCAARPLG